MGIRAGAEMTSLEARFVALRCQDTMAPTGTLALGIGAQQVNSRGQTYEAAYGHSTSQRVLALRRETEAGRGPCGLSATADEETRDRLYRAYLNMCPSQTLKFMEAEWANAKNSTELLVSSEIDPPEVFDWAPALEPPANSETYGLSFTEPVKLEAERDSARESRLTVQIEAGEPHVQGGHTAGGYWVDTVRRTTINGLWAAGDVSGGAPQKYVTGSLAEAEIAAVSLSKALTQGTLKVDLSEDPTRPAARLAREAACDLRRRISSNPGPYSYRDLEEALQKTLDLYAGGPGAGYRYGEAELAQAETAVAELLTLSEEVKAPDLKGLIRLWEVIDKLVVARSLIAHLAARKETRWPGFGVFSDHPEIDPNFALHVNSVLRGGEVEIIKRPLVMGESYEHPSETSDFRRASPARARDES
jgi:adenylylsulfate reductase subunit A